MASEQTRQDTYSLGTCIECKVAIYVYGGMHVTTFSSMEAVLRIVLGNSIHNVGGVRCQPFFRAL